VVRQLSMKLLRWLEWIAFAASVLVLLRVANGIATFMYLFGVDPIEPCVIAHGNFTKNGRADLVEGQARVCSIFSSEDRIGLILADKVDFITLVYYDQGPNSREPGLRWLDDDQLSVDLGEVKWLTPQIGQLGHVKISYSYSGAEPSLELIMAERSRLSRVLRAFGRLLQRLTIGLGKEAIGKRNETARNCIVLRPALFHCAGRGRMGDNAARSLSRHDRNAAGGVGM
jgi:hypothetical protein